MAEPRNPDPVTLVVACFSRQPLALEWAKTRLTETFGPVGLASVSFEFTQTSYYAATMGICLQKQFLVFADLIPPEGLAEIKRHTNALEKELADSVVYPEPRPLNLDPGLLSLGKFMLATTKDQAHRIYLGDGIFAEVTLRFQAGRFEPWPWTYADYRLPEVLSFLAEAREYHRERLQEVRHRGG